MSFLCSKCGQSHGDMPRYFHWRRPESAFDTDLEFVEDYKSMGRLGASRFFVRCEIEVPLASIPGTALGFVCWVEVSQDDYARLLNFRRDEDSENPFVDLVKGQLDNPVPCVVGSMRTEVAFEVIDEDPTPYIKWVQPDSVVEQLIRAGASDRYWHEAAERMGWKPSA